MSAMLVIVLRLLVVLSAYAFIGWIGYVIFSDFNRQITVDKKQSTVPPIKLEAVFNQVITQKGFEKQEIIIGRNPACDFPLNDETISLRHCKLAYYRKQWWAEDLDSTNGTLLNGTPLTTPTVITEGDELQFGRAQIKIAFH